MTATVAAHFGHHVPPQPVVDRLTEAGAAERFARAHGDDVRYDHRRQRWLVWRGHRWVPDADAAITRLVLNFAREWQREALDVPDRDRREAIIKCALRLEHRAVMGNVIALARALRPIADAGDGWDADPLLLGVPNGVVNLQTGELRPGRRDDRITLSAGVPFDGNADCPRWTQFLAEVFAGDAELSDFIQRAIGYSLTGITTEQCLFLLYGTGANGKGTLSNTLKRVFGDYSWNMPFATIELRDRAAIPNDLAALVNRRFVTASETNDGARLNEARVKALTGCDPVTARFLHGEFFTFEPIAKFWLSVNHKPIIRDDSYGFWRRLRLIPFRQTFSVNPTLTDEITAEAAGILAWAVRGSLAWLRMGLQPPGVVLDATQEYEMDSDQLGGFLGEACELEAESQVTASEFYEHYKRWADRHGFTERERLNRTMFGRKMSERFQKDRHRTEGVIYRGVARKLGNA